jgi:glycosyltransferase involved in cell wall biosynthesis
MPDRSYTVVIPCKDGETTIEQTLQSLFSQSIPASEIIVVDDASKDRTPQILKKHAKVYSIRLEHNLPRSWARVPRLINLALDQISKPVGYIMISGDDCIFPATYVQRLLEEFDRNPRLLICSGSHMKQKIVGQAAPHGAGRVFRFSFLKGILPFPVTIGWESWVLFKALERGGTTARVATVSFDHLKPYSSGSIWTFGHSMYELGYPFLFVLGRFAKNVLFEPHKLQQFHMLRGYLQYKITGRPRLDIADFVGRYQKQRVREFVTRLLRAKR